MILKNSYKMKPSLSVKPLKSILAKLNIVGLWFFNEGKGLFVEDLSLNINAGIFVGSPTWIIDKHGPCLDLDNDHVGGGDSIDLGLGIQDIAPGDGTVVWETKHDFAYNNNQIEIFWSQLNTLAVPWAPEFSAQKYSNNQFYIGFYVAGDDDRVNIPATAANCRQNAWNHYAFTWVNGGVSRFYHEGIEIGNNGGGTTIRTPLLNLFIHEMTSNPTHRFMDGKSNYFMICNRALTAGEIAHLYCKPFYMFERRSRLLYAPAAPPEIECLFMDLSTQYWAIKHSQGLLAKL